MPIRARNKYPEDILCDIRLERIKALKILHFELKKCLLQPTYPYVKITYQQNSTSSTVMNDKIILSKIISQELKRQRASRDMNQEQAAFFCNITLSEWQSLEQGKVKCPRIDTVVKIATAFSFSLDMLFGLPHQGGQLEAFSSVSGEG